MRGAGLFRIALRGFRAKPLAKMLQHRGVGVGELLLCLALLRQVFAQVHHPVQRSPLPAPQHYTHSMRSMRSIFFVPFETTLGRAKPSVRIVKFLSLGIILWHEGKFHPEGRGCLLTTKNLSHRHSTFVDRIKPHWRLSFS